MPTKPVLRVQKFNPFLDHHFHMEVEWRGDVADAQAVAERRGLEGAAALWTRDFEGDCSETVEQRGELWVFSAYCD